MVKIADLYSGIVTGLHAEPPLKTMSRKLIVNVAPTGSFTNRQQNPLQPYTMEENVRAAIEAYREGAAVWHVHAREKDGLPSKDPHVLKETIARVLDKCPDMVTSVIPYVDYDVPSGLDTIKRCVDVLTAAGPEYMQSAVMLIQSTSFSEKFTYVVTREILTQQVRYLEQHGVKPEYQGHSYSGLKDVQDWLLETGIAKQPPLMNVMMGFHGFSHGSPLSPDPWNYVYMMTMQATLPGSAVRGVCAGGRNWLPFTTLAIMLGFDVVRVGMEDSVYVWPHREEKLRTPAEAVRKVVAIAQELGREIATPSDAREIMGLTPVGAAASRQGSVPFLATNAA
jgi:3-keto-5-aminohexanoate cleavage enzyme